MAMVETLLSSMFSVKYDARFVPDSKRELKFVADKLPTQHTYICTFSLARNKPQWDLFQENKHKLNVLYESPPAINYLHPESNEGPLKSDIKYPPRCVCVVFEVPENAVENQ